MPMMPSRCIFAGLAGSRRKLLFGLDAPADVHAAGVVLDAQASRFILRTPVGECRSPVAAAGSPQRRQRAGRRGAGACAGGAAGRHRRRAGRMPNPCRAACCGAQSPQRLDPDRRQLQRQSGLGRSRRSKRWPWQPGERWLVLGDMAELGADAAALHAAHRTGRARARHRPRLHGRPAGGGRSRSVRQACPHFRGPDGLDRRVAAANCMPGSPALVKGSRRVAHGTASWKRCSTAMKGGDRHAA